MAESFLIIDGYNLLHAAGMARARYGPGDLQRARQRLLQYLLSSLAKRELARTIVVFDAHDPPPGLSRTRVVNGLRIRFADPEGEADIVIEDLIAAHSSPKQVKLVSSDHRLQTAARRRHASFLDSEAFVEFLERRPPPDELADKESQVALDVKPAGPSTPQELADWLQIFGDVSVVEMERELPKRPHLAPTRTNSSQSAVEAADEAPPQPGTKPAGSRTSRSRSARSHSARSQSARSQSARSQGTRSRPTPEPQPKGSQGELLGENWIAELQAWVDGLQG